MSPHGLLVYSSHKNACYWSVAPTLHFNAYTLTSCQMFQNCVIMLFLPCKCQKYACNQSFVIILWTFTCNEFYLEYLSLCIYFQQWGVQTYILSNYNIKHYLKLPTNVAAASCSAAEPSYMEQYMALFILLYSDTIPDIFLFILLCSSWKKCVWNKPPEKYTTPNTGWESVIKYRISFSAVYGSEPGNFWNQVRSANLYKNPLLH